MTREHRAQALADAGQIVRSGDCWLVPSATSDAIYRVSLVDGELHCTCPDFERRNAPCKHCMAAALVAAKESSRMTHISSHGDFFDGTDDYDIDPKQVTRDHVGRYVEVCTRGLGSGRRLSRHGEVGRVIDSREDGDFLVDFDGDGQGWFEADDLELLADEDQQ